MSARELQAVLHQRIEAPPIHLVIGSPRADREPSEPRLAGMGSQQQPTNDADQAEAEAIRAELLDLFASANVRAIVYGIAAGCGVILALLLWRV